MLIEIIGGCIALILMVIGICMFAWYRILPTSEAHVVVTPHGKFVASSDETIGERKYYFEIPENIPFIGRTVRKMSLIIQELVIKQETVEENQGRYNVTSSTKYRIKDVMKAAETFSSNGELQEQLKEVIRSGVRAITVKYNVIDARAKKQEMSEKIREEIEDDLNKWGLELISFQLVEFKDVTNEKGEIVSSIISDISKRREVEIESQTREKTAMLRKIARVKEAEADEQAQKREIERDRLIGEQEQLKKQKISEQEKTAKEKEYEVIKVETIKKAEIERERANIEAEQEKEVAKIHAEEMKLEGIGMRDKLKEEAVGKAAEIKEKGLAEAEAKMKLQEALNLFKTDAIRALTAEKIVEKDKEVGIAMANALQYADLKAFLGGGDSTGFDFGKIVEQIGVANDSAQLSFLNKVSRPNDLGFKALALKQESEKSEKKSKKEINKRSKEQSSKEQSSKEQSSKEQSSKEQVNKK